MASRASTRLGLIGVIFWASLTNWSIVWFPVGTSLLAPAASWIIRLRTSQRVRHHISPVLWTSNAPLLLKVIGLGAIPPERLLVMSSASAQVIGLMVLSVVYGKRRIP